MYKELRLISAHLLKLLTHNKDFDHEKPHKEQTGRQLGGIESKVQIHSINLLVEYLVSITESVDTQP
jgi:hypothetical protein